MEHSRGLPQRPNNPTKGHRGRRGHWGRRSSGPEPWLHRRTLKGTLKVNCEKHRDDNEEVAENGSLRLLMMRRSLLRMQKKEQPRSAGSYSSIKHIWLSTSNAIFLRLSVLSVELKLSAFFSSSVPPVPPLILLRIRYQAEEGLIIMMCLIDTRLVKWYLSRLR